jgi:hypothetical protein
MCNCTGNTVPNDCNDYSLLTANTGIAQITTANSSLLGASSTAIFTAASNGSIIKSIRIKAISPVIAKGMLRIFVGKGDASVISLYKEIQVPPTPQLAAMPMPFPVLPMFEMVLRAELRLESGMKLYASTQNTQAFNLITEGLDWDYPETLPDTCCNFKQETAVTGVNIASVANANMNGGGNIAVIFTEPGSTNGSFIKTITIKALQSTSINGMLRLYISPDGTTFSLFQEIMIPETTQAAYEPSYKVVVDLNMNIETGHFLGASTQLGQSFAFTVEGASWKYPI